MRIEELRILVVDDHSFQRWAVRNILTALGATQVLLAHDGTSAMRMLRDTQAAVDIVITDLDMPGMDGMELIRHLAREHAPASLIITSGLGHGVLSSVRSMADAYGVHVIAALEKPVSMRKLREAVERHVARVTPAPASAARDAVEVAGAIHEDEIEPRFEPRIDIESRAIVAAQVAPVWVEPCGRITPAGSFARVAKTAGLAPRLGWRLIQKALPACAEWRRNGLQLGVCVPIGAESLLDPAYAQRLRDFAATTGLEPGAILLQFDVARLMDGLGTMLENISRLRMLGFGVALPYGPDLCRREDIAAASCSELVVDLAAARPECARDEAGAVRECVDAARHSGVMVCGHGIASRDDWDLAARLGAHTAAGPGLGAPLPAGMFAQETARRPTWKGYR